jgi:chromosomal replication initiation ATPase DnaA
VDHYENGLARVTGHIYTVDFARFFFIRRPEPRTRLISIVWYVGRKLGEMSLKTLGEQSGGSDYATVSAAIKRMERRLQKRFRSQ